MMCGVFTDHFPEVKREWNALLDPHATAIVYKAPVGRHRSIGLDVTLQVEMKKQEVLDRFALSPLLAPVIDFAEHWDKDSIIFHDPLAAVTVRRPRANTVPTNRSTTFFQVGAVNSGSRVR